MPATTSDKNNSVIQKRFLSILFFVWLIIQLFTLSQFGIVTHNEAVKYINEAQFFLNHGHYSEQKYLFYSAYIFLHVLFLKAGFEITGVYLTQLFGSLFAMFFFFKTVYRVSKNVKQAFVTTFLLLVCYTWQWWTVFLYTESLFCSLLIIFTYLVFGINKRVIMHDLLASLVFILILFARPTGILLIPVICLLLFYKLIKRKKIISAIVFGLVIFSVFVILLNFSMNAGSDFDFIKPLVENNVLCYDSEEPVIGIHINDHGLKGVIDYIQDYPGNFLRLAGLKFVSYWSLTRPGNSALHNWWLRLFFYPLYACGFIGIFNLKKGQTYFLLYCLGIFAIFTTSVMVSCDDSDNRFIVAVIPLVIFLAGFGINRVFPKLSGTKSA